MTIIEWVNQVLVHKKPWDSFSESDKKTFNTFIINRWLSMDEEFIEIINYLQKYWFLESKEVYKFYCDVLPKGKRFNKYIKPKGKKKYDEILIKTLCKYFECSKLEVMENIEFLSKDNIKIILEKYGTDPKQIKNICKRNL